jgi:myosin heavy subunit
VKIKATNKEEEKRMCLAMVQSLKLQDRQYRLGSSLILLKREVVDEMERKRGLLLVEYAITLQRTVRRYVSLGLHEKKKDLRRNFQSILKLQSMFRRSMARPKYAKILEVVQQSTKRKSVQSGDSNDSPETAVDAALASLLAENIEKKVS